MVVGRLSRRMPCRIGKRGANEMLLSVLVQLAILGIITATFITYVGAKTDNSAYFMELYAKDLGSLAELASASPGRLQITYDNLKPGLPIEVESRKGKVSIKKIVTEGGSFSKDFYYGTAEITSVPAGNYPSPIFLALVTQASIFSIKDASGYLQVCEMIAPAIPRDKLRLLVELKDADGNDLSSVEFVTGMHEAMSAAMGSETPRTDNENPNMHITAILTPGTNNAVDYSYGTNDLAQDAEYMKCILRGTFETSAPAFSESESQQTAASGIIRVQLTIKQPERILSDRDIGEIIGRGVAIYAR